MTITIRQENSCDHIEVERLIEEAFAPEEHSDHTEHLLVGRLRNAGGFVPELSLVACSGNEIVGHILLTPITIGKGNHPSLALAPLSVHTGLQKRGIGGMLIRAAHDKARESGYESVVVLGHKEYYPRFGYKPLSGYGIRLPFDVPEEYCMAVEFRQGALNGVSGMVSYPPEFA